MTLSAVFLWDFAATVWFLLCWVGYAAFAKRRARRVDCLMRARKDHLRRWTQSMNRREIRIADAALLAILERNVTFFASTSMLILVGLISGLGYTGHLAEILSGVSYAIPPSGDMLLAKMGLLMLCFIYAFFTFTWSMRQFNYAAIMIGGAPLPADEKDDHERDLAAIANVLSLAATTFNSGLRAYYFSLAALAWFLHPLLFMAAAVWVVWVLYRREFRSKTLLAMLRELD